MAIPVFGRGESGIIAIPVFGRGESGIIAIPVFGRGESGMIAIPVRVDPFAAPEIAMFARTASNIAPSKTARRLALRRDDMSLSPD
jgi:hypothetical protein